LIEALRDAAKPIAFSSGVELLPPFDVTVESQTLHREKLEDMQRRLAEKRAQGHAQHIQRATELLKQFQSLRDAAPTLSPGQVLEQISPADRGNMLETLLLASAGESPSLLYAVAGPNLLRMNPRQFPMHADIVPLSSALGPARSVQPAAPPPLAASRTEAQTLLIGAQTGVILLDPSNPTHPTLFRDPTITSQLGFNNVALVGDRIWASHSEAGVVAWDIDSPSAPAITLRTPGARNLVPFDHACAIFSAGNDTFIATSDGQSRWIDIPTAAPVLFITTDHATITLIRADGAVERIDRATLKLTATDRRAGELSAAATLPWLGTTRLLLATGDGPIICFGHDDSLTTQFVSSHRGLRALASSADTLAAVSPDRQRVVLWKTWDPRQPAGEFHLAASVRHRAADICFA
jgi:hypothetical protein